MSNCRCMDCTVRGLASHDESRHQKRAQLLELTAELNDDCLDALVLQAKAMLRGHKEYGPLDLDNDDRNMVKEAIEEARDLAIYLNFRLIQIERYDRG